uniref:Uncharacterized protein n=1 Tax=Anopheles albimanus TaxID=7167 RepID=A0A182FQT5_ANOAL
MDLFLFVSQLFVALVLSEELHPDGTQEDLKSDAATAADAAAADGIVALHRTKRHDVEIHRVIKRRPKLPPPGSRGRKPRPPRRPASKPRVKYGPPNVNYAPLSHYVPQSIEDPFSSGFDNPFADHQQQHHHHHGSFGEPPVSSSYSSSIHPSPTFGSPPFAYGGGGGGGPSSSIITSYESSSFGKPPASSYELLSTGPSSFGSKPSYESSLSFGSSKPGYHGAGSTSFGSHKPTFDSTAFGGAGLSKTSFGNGPSVFDSKVPSFLDSPSSSPTSGFDHLLSGSKPQSHGPVGGYSHSFTHPSVSSSGAGKLQPHFADSTAINTYTTPSGVGGKGGSFYSEIGSYGLDAHSKPQLPLETYKKDPYKTPLTSYEVPITNSKSNLFEPSHDFDTSTYKRAPHYSGGGGGGGSVSSTHSTSHSTSDASEEYIPSLPTRYDQDQFHTPTKANPNKPPGSGNSFPNLGNDNDPFTSFTSYYDGASESQKIPVKSQHQPTSFGSDGTSSEQYPGAQAGAGGKGRIRTRRKKKPAIPGPTIAHNLDTDDLRDAFGSSSDFHQVAIDADEFLEFEPKKQIKHSKPAGVTLARAGDSERAPSNFVLLSSQNKQSAIGQSKERQRSPTTATGSQAIADEHELSTNFFQTTAGQGGQRSGTKPTSANNDLNILSIQKSNSKSYYAGSSQASAGSDLRPTRRRDMLHYRSATSLDYTMLDEDDDDDENYDEISDIGTRYRGRKKKDLSEATTHRPSVTA